MNYSPIVIFVYNRVYHLDILLNSLKKNDIFKKSKVIVFSDGPKNEIDKKKILKVRELLKKKLIYKNSEIIENNVNLGLSRNIIYGLNKIFQIYNKAIVLEDDLEVSPFFLNYMNDSLNLYANSENVASISGYMYPIEPKKFSNNYFFLKLIESWGWGTWKRAWNIFEKNGSRLKKKIDIRQLINEFNFSSGVSYYKMLENNINGLNDSWAIRWYASTFLKDMYTLFPRKSYVKNIGIDNSGENCNSTNVYNNSLNFKYNKLKKIDISESVSDRLLMKSFFQKIKYKKYLDNVINKIKNFIK
jgi:hypothetical protein